jgi:TolB-like protein
MMTIPALPKRFLICLTILLLAGATAVQAQGKQVKIAFVKIENSSNDPRYDYLEGIVSGTLLFDLSNAPGMVVVDRSSLDAILKEQELMLSDLVKSETAVRVGKILGADYLLKGNYVFLGGEIRLNLSLIEVETAKTMSFSETGSTENLVHVLAERIIERLTGDKVALRSDEHDRSIISLKDEKPGSIGLFCNLIDAEIFVDDQFVCYTTGKSNVPSELTDLKPGKHTVRVHLSSFGVVKTPEITFSDWQQTADVKPGQRQVLRATIWMFTDQLYELQKLCLDSVKIKPDKFGQPFSKEVSMDFTDRGGKKVSVVLRFTVIVSQTQADLKAELVYNGKTAPVTLSCAAGKEASATKTVEKADLKLEMDFSPVNGCEIDYRVTRNDISQDMWHED